VFEKEKTDKDRQLGVLEYTTQEVDVRSFRLFAVAIFCPSENSKSGTKAGSARFK